jgi:hypothetical protein
MKEADLQMKKADQEEKGNQIIDHAIEVGIFTEEQEMIGISDEFRKVEIETAENYKAHPREKEELVFNRIIILSILKYLNRKVKRQELLNLLNAVRIVHKQVHKQGH